MPNEIERQANPVIELLGKHAVILGLLLRLFLAWFLPWLMDGGPVPYTDIDFHVFTDAARHIQQGGNPFDRHTYRYTPFLAAGLAHFPSLKASRYLFCVADALCGWLILRVRKQQRRAAHNSKPGTSWQIFLDAAWWLYNPLAINICTRGSSESLQVLLPVLMTLQLVQSSDSDSSSWKQALVAGICHGVAIHSKLYPIIYSLSYMAYYATLSESNWKENMVSGFPWTQPLRLVRVIRMWVVRLLQPAPLVFVTAALSTFAILTYLAVVWYGDIALEEGLLYHFSRVDHRHNYSMYWYWIYLARARESSILQSAGRLLLVPQLILLVYTSLGIAPMDLGLALFCQTFLFVTHNKVITAQYFTWYLCLLPLCSDSLRWTKRVQVSLVLLLLSIAFWLGSAFCLEMLGMAVHRLVWFASVVYFFANVNLLGALVRSSTLLTTQSSSDQKEKEL